MNRIDHLIGVIAPSRAQRRSYLRSAAEFAGQYAVAPCAGCGALLTWERDLAPAPCPFCGTP